MSMRRPRRSAKPGKSRSIGPEGFAGMRKAGRLVAECLDLLTAEVKPGVRPIIWIASC